MKAAPARTAWLEAALIFLVALAWRLPGMTQEWAGDELYQVLAAKQYLVDGSLSIAGGAPYERGHALTVLVAWLFRAFGESVLMARLPALLCGCLAVAIVFLWLRARGQRMAAWTAALLLALDPESVKLSQMMRFYTPQLLLFLVGVMAGFALIERRRSVAATAGLALLAAASLFGAYELQLVTAIGIAGLGLYAALVLGPGLVARARAGWSGRLELLGVLAAGAVALLALLYTGFFDQAAHFATYTDLWARESASNLGFYVGVMIDAYPGLWAFFALAVVLAATQDTHLALLSTSVYGTALFVHSLLAWKAERYLFYALPFFFIVLGLAVARVAGPLRSLVDGLVAKSPLLSASPRRARASRDAILVAVVLFAALSHPALIRSARGLLQDPSYRHPGMGRGSLSWGRASQVLAPVAQQSDAVVATDDLKALYYLGRLDYVLDRDHLWEDRTPEVGPRPEFALDVKINRPMVSEARSIERIMACYESGLIVAQEWAMETPYFVPPETRRFILERGEPIALPPEWGIAAFRWTTPHDRIDRDCPPRPATDRIATGAPSS